MKTPPLRVRHLVGVLVISCFVAGCTRQPAAKPHPPQAASVAPAVKPVNWSNMSTHVSENDPIKPYGMPEPEDELLIDPLGGPDAMVQRIEVRGFGSVESAEVFLKVEGSNRTAKVGDQVLDFLVTKTEDPFVTLELDGREWKLSTANKHIKKDDDLETVMPVLPPVLSPEMPPDEVDLEMEAEMALVVDEAAAMLEEEMAPEIPDMSVDLDPDGLGLDADGLGLDPAGDAPADSPGSGSPGGGVGPPGAP